MADRPILFSAQMVRALLACTKSQTRRPLRDGTWWTPEHGVIRQAPAGLACTGFAPVPCPYGKPGDRLWVRETWQGPIMSADEWEQHGNDDPQSLPSRFNSPSYCEYAADGGAPPEFMTADDELVCRWRPSIHMPRWASRITLAITEVRVDRLQDISRGDAMAEGCPFANMAAGPDPRDWYRDLWNEINGAGAWDLNPWVWCVAFKRVNG